MGDLGQPDSPTTLDIHLAPQDELLMTFSSAASASNSSESFIASTKGPDLFALPLSAGIAVSGTLVDDASTLTAPFLPGDRVLACLVPPKSVLLSAYEDSLRLRIPTISALEIPDSMLPETATSYMTALIAASAILHKEFNLPVLRTPTASPNPAEEGGVETYNNKRILVVGGQTSLGAATVQLLRRALPDAKVISILEDEVEVYQRTLDLVALGATSAVDADTDDVTDRLPPSVDIIINTVRSETVKKDVMDLLDGLQRFVDCSDMDVEAAVSKLLDDEPDCITALHEELLKAGNCFTSELDDGLLGDSDDSE